MAYVQTIYNRIKTKTEELEKDIKKLNNDKTYIAQLVVKNNIADIKKELCFLTTALKDNKLIE